MTTRRPALLRTVLFGAGRRGLSTHVAAIAASPRLDLARVVDLEPELPRVTYEVDRLRTVHDLPGNRRRSLGPAT